MRWVGRPLPRYEDPVLLQGRGRYTADLAQDARILRFVRSPVARGRILAVNAPPEVPMITAAVLGDVKPICPRLDRPDYVPVAQPILAHERVTYVGEPIAAVIADTAAEAEDLAEQVAVEIAAETPVVTLDQALAPGAPLVHDIAAQNTLIDARFETAGVAASFATAHQVVEFTFTSGRQAAVPLEPRGAVAAFDPRTGRVTLSASTQMPHLLRTGIADALGIAGIRTPGRRARGRRRLRPEDGADPGICRRRSGRRGASPARVAWIEDRLRKSNRLVSRARPAPPVARRVRCRRPVAGHRRRYPLQCRRLFEFPGHLRGRTVDGAGRHARALPRARVPRPCPRRRQQHLPDGALSRRVAARHHCGDGAADGLRGRPARARHARNPAPQPDHRFPAYLGDRRRSRPGQLSRGDGGCGAGRRHRRIPRAPTNGARRWALARPRHIGVRRAHRPGHSRLCGAAHGDDAGLRAGRAGDGPLGLSRSPDRQLAARSGAEDDLGAADRRRDRRRAPTRSVSLPATPTAPLTAGALSPAARW